MKTPILTARTNKNTRRSFLHRCLLVALSTAATAALPKTANAAFGPSNVPTELLLSISPSTRLTGTISVAAQIRRLDGGTAGLSGQQIQFWIGNPTYPTTMLSRRVTNPSGLIRFTFQAAVLKAPGRYILLADMNPQSCAEGWIANPRPYAWFTVVR